MVGSGIGGGGMSTDDGCLTITFGFTLGDDNAELLREGRWNPITADPARWNGLPPDGDRAR